MRWFLSLFHYIFHPAPLLELDLEDKRTDLFWRQFHWRKQLMDGSTHPSPYDLSASRRGARECSKRTKPKATN
jgi:hypothetical protein